jgi:hypothetical protein
MRRWYATPREIAKYNLGLWMATTIDRHITNKFSDLVEGMSDEARQKANKITKAVTLLRQLNDKDEIDD